MDAKKNNRTNWNGLFGLLVVIALLYASVPRAFAQQDPIKIGVILPLSGVLEAYGQQALQGARMAVAEINAAGGVLGGRQFELIVEDNQTDVLTSGRQAKKLIEEDHVLAILGPFASASRNAVTPRITALKTPLLYATDYEGGECNRYVFCYSALPAHYVSPLLPYLKAHHGNSFYLLGVDSVWPRTMNAAMKQAIVAQKGTLKGEEYLPVYDLDFSRSIENIDRSGADVLILTLPAAAEFVKQFRAADLPKNLTIALMEFNENILAEDMTKNDAEGIITITRFMQSLDQADTQNFVARQRAMFGENTIVTFTAEGHYGLLMLFKRAIEAANSDEKEEIIDAMAGQTVVAGNGPVTMHDDHHMTLNIMIGEVVNGELMMREEIGPVTAPDQCRGKSMIGGNK